MIDPRSAHIHLQMAPTPRNDGRPDAISASLRAIGVQREKCPDLSIEHGVTTGSSVPLHWVCAGHGQKIVLIHGFPAFWYCWTRQIAALADAFQVIAIDAPGAGASGRPDDPAAYRLPALADALDQLLDAVAGDERCVLVGHDWGAALAFAFAQARPERLAGVVGMCAPPANLFLDLFAHDPQQQARSAYMARLRAMDARGAAAAAVDLANRAYGTALKQGAFGPEDFARLAAGIEDPAALLAGAAWYRANVPAPGMPAPRWPVDDASLAIPALLIWGEADPTFLRDVPDRFVAQHHGAEVLRLPGVGHWPMFEATDLVNRALRDFAGSAAVMQRMRA